jgi:hypothetical protein
VAFEASITVVAQTGSARTRTTGPGFRPTDMRPLPVGCAEGSVRCKFGLFSGWASQTRRVLNADNDSCYHLKRIEELQPRQSQRGKGTDLLAGNLPGGETHFGPVPDQKSFI